METFLAPGTCATLVMGGTNGLPSMHTTRGSWPLSATLGVSCERTLALLPETCAAFGAHFTEPQERSMPGRMVVAHVAAAAGFLTRHSIQVSRGTGVRSPPLSSWSTIRAGYQD